MQIEDDFGVEPETSPVKRWKDMTAEERRQVDAARKRGKRKDARVKAAAERSGTREEYWQGERAQLSADDRASFERQQEKVLDQLSWMHYGVNLPEDDPDYIPFDEALADLVQFVKDHPCPHTYGWNRGGLSPLWSTEKFWADPKTMEVITDEGYATEVWARYGYWTGIEDAKVYFFLTDTLRKLGRKPRTGEAVMKLLGMVTDGNIIRYPKEK